MKRQSGRVVLLEGIDGSGKSSLSRTLVDRLTTEGYPARLLDRPSATTHLSGYLADHMSSLRRLIWDYPSHAVTSQLGHAHWANLIASWFHALDHTVIRPSLSEGVWLVADSSHYKFVARFALSEGLDRAEQRFAGITAPDAVCWLDVSPARCLERKHDLRPTECGEWLGYSPAGETFIGYQSEIRNVYLQLAEANGWHRIQAVEPADVAERAFAIATAEGETS